MPTVNDPRPPHPQRWAILWVACAALLLVVIDVTVLHVAAPAISADLDPTAVQLLWIIDIYSLVAPPLLLATGVLGDRFGRRTLLAAGMAVFGIASLAAALSPSAPALIASRALLGIGGAMVLPTTMSIVRDAFPNRAERVKAVGIWTAVSAGGAAVGPLLGGFLVEHFTWHAVFLINVPIVVAVIPFAIRLVPQSRSENPPPWDTVSILLGGVGVLGLAFGIKEAARFGLVHPKSLVPLILGLLSLFLFCRSQLRASRPLLDIRLFRKPEFAVSVGAVFLSMFGLVGMMFFAAQYLQLVLDLGPLAAAVRLIPLMVASLAGGLIAAWFVTRFGTRRTISLGLAATAVGLIPMLWLGLADQYFLLWPAFILIGVTLEVALVAANDVIISAVPADRVGGVSAIEEIAYELGSGFGIVVLGSVLAAVYTSRLVPVELIGASGMGAARESLNRALEVAEGLSAQTGEALTEAARLAFVSGFHAMIATSILLIGTSAIAAWLMLRPPGPGPVGAENEAAAGPTGSPESMI